MYYCSDLLLVMFEFYRDAKNMARDVHDIVVKVVQEKGNMDEAQANAYVKKMEAQKRYSSDVWSWNSDIFIGYVILVSYCYNIYNCIVVKLITLTVGRNFIFIDQDYNLNCYAVFKCYCYVIKCRRYE